MGFSIEAFFEELRETLAKEQKAGKTVKQLSKIISEAYVYAIQCNIIKKDGD